MHRNSMALRYKLFLLATFLVLLHSPPSSWSQSPSGPLAAADVKRAKEYVDAAVIAQQNGDFRTAIDLYTKANAVAPHPELIYNLAQAHRQANEKTKDAKDRDAARAFYRAYVEKSPNGPSVSFAKEWLVKLDAQYTSERPAEEAAERAVVLHKIKDERLAAEAVERDKQRKATEVASKIDSAVSSTIKDNTQRKAKTLKWVGIGVGGLGVAALGTGVYYGLAARSIEKSLETSKKFDTDEISRGNRYQRFMYIGYASSAALLMGGAVTYYLGTNAAAQERAIQVQPIGGGGAAGLALSGRF
jgi:tetratricopeptide (TPR) repeat protein